MTCVAAAKRLAFTQYESEVHAQLSGLILDATSMHAIFAQAFRIQGGALCSVAQQNAPPLTHQQMTGAPHATYAIEHHTHSQPIGGKATGACDRDASERPKLLPPACLEDVGNCHQTVNQGYALQWRCL